VTYEPTGDPYGQQQGQQPPKKKGGVLLIVGAILLVLGIVLAVVGSVALYGGVSSFAGGLTEFEAPGSTTFTADEPGSYVVFAEGTSVPEGLEVTIAGPEGETTEPGPADVQETLDLGERQLRSARSFRADEAGAYAISATLPEGQTATLLVGPSVMGLAGAGVTFLGGFCIGIPLGLAGVVCLIIGLVKRFSS